MAVSSDEPSRHQLPGEPVPAVSGAIELATWFGRWPSFHDAEVVSVHLNRSGQSFLDVHAWLLGAPDPVTGQLGREGECLVRFTLSDVTDLELADFSEQNVVAGLSLLRDGSGWRLKLAPCYGLAGYIKCADVAISFTKGGPRTA
jgi:Immunity protein 50